MKTVRLHRGETLTVRWPVTARHLIKGTPRHCTTCPVALSLNDIFPGLEAVVNTNGLSLVSREDRPGIILWASTTKEIISYIVAVDDDEPVGPARFEVSFEAFENCEVTYDETG